MSAPVPPDYTGFRVLLVAAVCLAVIAIVWWIVDAQYLRLIGLG